jgi:hypothetical protein
MHGQPNIKKKFLFFVEVFVRKIAIRDKPKNVRRSWRTVHAAVSAYRNVNFDSKYRWKHSMSNSRYSQAASSQRSGKRKLVDQIFVTYCRVCAGCFVYVPTEYLQPSRLLAKRAVWKKKEFWRNSLLITFGIFTYLLDGAESFSRS